MAGGIYYTIAKVIAAKVVLDKITPKPVAAPGVGNAGTTEARRLAEMKQRTDQRRRAGFNQTQGAGLSGVTSILGG
jgi:hypothetical protein